jgi:beta-lactamase regulating signal transducer with metallopeptidase domain
MNYLLRLIVSSDAADALATSLLHSLWQASVIGLVFLVLLKRIPTLKSALRYKLGLLSLLALLLCWLGTLSILNQSTAEAKPPIATLHASSAPAARTAIPANDTEMTPVVKSENNPTVARPAPQAPERTTQYSIHNILILLWSIGVSLMVIRLFIAMAGTQRHRTRSIVIEDPALLARFEKLCKLQKLTRTILFAATTTLNNPGVIGILRPMVLIPTSMLTGFSPSDLEAVVAHELAHIRRHDYLFNLLQMVMESLFFFNPAVWWISHRIRMEREACCDAEAMRATGQKFEYANLLLNAFGGSPAAVPAFSSDKKADAKERLLRIVQPNNRFSVRIGATRLLLLLTLTTAALVALAKTSDLAVETVAKILTPKERVEKLMELADQAPPVDDTVPAQKVPYMWDYSNSPKIHVSGMVKMDDGFVMPLEKLHVNYTSVEKPTPRDGDPKLTMNPITIEPDGSFCATNLPALGIQYLQIASSNYFSPTFETEELGDLTNIVLTLNKGFDGKLIVLNEDRTPIPNASVRLIYTQGPFYQYYSQGFEMTDEKGRLTYPHQNPEPIALDIHAKGYQSMDFYPASFAEKEPLIIQMTKGHTIPGKVVDQKTGLPIADAQVILTERETNMYGFGMKGEMMTLDENREIARTDPSGNFTIDTIGTNETFFISVKALGKTPSLVGDITTKTKQIDVQLVPKRIIRGTLTGDFSKIENGPVNIDGKWNVVPAIRYMTSGSYQDVNVPVTITNGVGHFFIEDIPGDWVEISTTVTDRKIAEIWFSERSEYDLNINLDSDRIEHGPDSRMIEFNIQTPEGLPKAEGSMTIEYATTLEIKNNEIPKSPRVQVSITNGSGRLQIPAPAYITLYSAKDIKGYWIEPLPNVRKSTLLIESSKEPYRYEIQAAPSGGVHGNVFNADRQPAGEFTSWVIFNSEEDRVRTWKFGFVQENRDSFAIPSIPLNIEFALLVEKDSEWIVSEPMTLTEENPILNTDLQFNPSKPIEGRVLNPDGTPASYVYVQIMNRFTISEGFSDYDYGNGINADVDGYFRWDQVSIDPRFKYKLRIYGQDKYKDQMIPVEPGSSKTYTHKLKK